MIKLKRRDPSSKMPGVLAITALLTSFGLGGCTTLSSERAATEDVSAESYRNVATDTSPTPNREVMLGATSGTASDGESSGRVDPTAAVAPPVSTDEAAAPTRASQPEPALSDEEISRTYGAGEPEPAESMEATLCNLNRSHVEHLAGMAVSNDQLDDQMLRIAALALSDDLGVWDGMAWQYPELASELDTARSVYEHWEYAVGLLDSGDSEGALREVRASEVLIESLPTEGIVEGGCS